MVHTIRICSAKGASVVKMQEDLHDIENVFSIIVGIDAIDRLMLEHSIACHLEVHILIYFCHKTRAPLLLVKNQIWTYHPWRWRLLKLNKLPPIPVDIFIAQNTKVLVITGPNIGGKTICLKTVGLAAVMAKSGRSNAINIGQRLGIAEVILDNARELYGVANAEINEVILEIWRDLTRNFMSKFTRLNIT
ncbi:uncharacterized protein LOC116001926 isoform X2 [Ipomoea triloba]|uniref:uncharacterized protein LOC116001926 isoform X2 n=1 Tax=Ipomoea triloba TaxID=35885 RepID=UPI00125D00AD|nr:uncharacterized protein LOC116001926 isoform X2 [Ipomoea triloba]